MTDAELAGSDVPVVLVIYNRADTAAQVFRAIRAARPRRLVIVADAPRARDGDAARVAAARDAVADVDWPCDVQRDYRSVNRGAGRSVADACDLAFADADAAIILEDDCLPARGFFRFCTELLERYRDDARVAQVTGTNPFDEWRPDLGSYHFANYGTAQGWATWRRVWRHFAFDTPGWDMPAAAAALRRALLNDDEVRFSLRWLAAVRAGRVDTWDVQFDHAKFKAGALSIVPARSMVANLGMGGGTNTRRRSLLDAVRRTHPAEFPLRHPAIVACDRLYDRRVYEIRSEQPSADGLVALATYMLSRGRPDVALAIAKGGRRQFEDERLAALEARALATLRGGRRTG